MAELLDAVTSWSSLLLVLVVFGFAPGFCLRLIVLAYPRGDPRRAELIAELYAVPRLQRPLWVAEQLEVALFEGLAHRASAALRQRTGRCRARTRSGHRLVRLKLVLGGALGGVFVLVIAPLGLFMLVIALGIEDRGLLGFEGGLESTLLPPGLGIGIGIQVGLLVALGGGLGGGLGAMCRIGKPDGSGSRTGIPRSEADDPDRPGRGPDL